MILKLPPPKACRWSCGLQRIACKRVVISTACEVAGLGSARWCCFYTATSIPAAVSFIFLPTKVRLFSRITKFFGGSVSIQYGSVSIHFAGSSAKFGSSSVPRETLSIKKHSGMYYDSRIFCYLCTRIKDKTTMDIMKVISIRMTEEELAEIDEALKPHRYYKRSNFIRAAVRVLLNANAGTGPEKDVADRRMIIHKSLYMPFGLHTGLNVHLDIEHYDTRPTRNT